MRAWQVERRKRTRHLIELGGLVVKAGIVDLTGDDRATIFGALLWMADKLQSDQGGGTSALGRQRNGDIRWGTGDRCAHHLAGNAVRVESFSTIADKDNHAAGGGWRSAQALQTITPHVRDGEVSRHRVNIPPPGMRPASQRN
jgi:hypothetical protein